MQAADTDAWHAPPGKMALSRHAWHWAVGSDVAGPQSETLHSSVQALLVGSPGGGVVLPPSFFGDGAPVEASTPFDGDGDGVLVVLEQPTNIHPPVTTALKNLLI